MQGAKRPSGLISQLSRGQFPALHPFSSCRRCSSGRPGLQNRAAGCETSATCQFIGAHCSVRRSGRFSKRGGPKHRRSGCNSPGLHQPFVMVFRLQVSAAACSVWGGVGSVQVRGSRPPFPACQVSGPVSGAPPCDGGEEGANPSYLTTRSKPNQQRRPPVERKIAGAAPVDRATFCTRSSVE